MFSFFNTVSSTTEGVVLAVTALLSQVFGFGYWTDLTDHFLKCRQPITYAVGTVDPRFNLSKSDLKADLKAAELVWEKPLGLNLFQESATGTVKVNLIYDSRQLISEQVQKGKMELLDKQKVFDQHKATYDARVADLKARVADYKARGEEFDRRNKEYARDVDLSNGKGGAPAFEYQRLVKEQKWLKNEAIALNELGPALSDEAREINGVAALLNKMVANFRLTAKKINALSQSRGVEFNEGIYRQNGKVTEIDIYQFENKNQLVRVLAHELGHALGLSHIPDEGAIMYETNLGTNLEATTADLEAVNKACGKI